MRVGKHGLVTDDGVVGEDDGVNATQDKHSAEEKPHPLVYWLVHEVKF